MTYQAASSSSSSLAAAAAANVCYRYAVVRDVAAHTDIDVCSSTERVSHAYTSVGSSLEIRLFRQRLPANQSSIYSIPPVTGPFLLHYSGTLYLFVYLCLRFLFLSSYYVIINLFLRHRNPARNPLCTKNAIGLVKILLQYYLEKLSRTRA